VVFVRRARYDGGSGGDGDSDSGGSVQGRGRGRMPAGCGEGAVVGSCLTVEQRPAAAAVSAPSGKAGEGRRREEEAPGRIAGNGVGNAACLFTRQGRKGTNQDAMIVWEVYMLSTTETLRSFLYDCVYFSFFLFN
jgi:hypothetical protein